MEFDKVKDRIAFKLVNRKRPGYPLDEIPHTDFLDLTFIYYVVADMDEIHIDTVLVTNENLDRWGVSDDDLYDISLRNFDRLFRFDIEGRSGRDMFLLITTKFRMFGAVYLADEKLMAVISKFSGSDLCIIPSSIHELIILPADYIEKNEMDRIIREVNEEAVEEKDFLSDHMYRYSVQEGKVIY